jgi:ParB-like chromosome segregation protein Spo0J
MTKTEPKSVMKDLRPQDITTNGNVRTTTQASEDKELLNSVKEHGVIEPIIVRKQGAKHILIAGHRRLNAAKTAKKGSIPVRIIDVDENQALEIQIIENLQRRDLTPLEEAEAYGQLIAYNGTQPVWDHKGKKQIPNNEFVKRVALVAKVVGKAATYVTRVLRLLELPKQILDWIRKGKLTAMHGAVLVDLPELTRGQVLKNFLITKVTHLKEGDVFPVSDLKNHIEQHYARDLKQAPFPTNCEFACEVSCTSCPYNSGNAMALFGGTELGSCRQPKCWNKKKDQVWKNVKEAEIKKYPLFKTTRFAGFAGMVEDMKGTRLPYRIKKLLVIKDSAKVRKVFETADADVRREFGWAIVKVKEGKKPEYQVVFTSLNDVVVSKALGIKLAKLKGDAPKEDRQDYERHNFIANAVQEVIGTKVDEALIALKPSQSFFYILAIEHYGEWEREWTETAKLLKITLPKAKKGTHPLESLPLPKLAMLWMATEVHTQREHDGAEMLGLDIKKLVDETATAAGKSYDENKAKEKAKKVTEVKKK